MFQVIFWILVAATCMLPFVLTAILLFALSWDSSHSDPNFCFPHLTIAGNILLAFIHHLIPPVIFFILSVVLIVFCCKTPGKGSDQFARHCVISACISCVVYTLFRTLGVFTHVILRDFVYKYLPSLFILGACSDPLVCTIWLVVCKEIRRLALCKPPKSDEETELIPK